MIFIAITIQWIVFLVVVAAAASVRRLSVYHPICFYAFFHFLVFVLRPALVYVFGYHTQFDFMGYYPDDATILLTLAVSSFGFVSFVGACAIASRCSISPGLMQLALPSSLDRKSFFWTVVTFSPVFVYSCYLNATSSFSIDGSSWFDTGGIEMSLDPVTGNVVFLNNTGYFVLAVNIGGTFCLAFLWLSRFRWYAWIPLLSYVLFRMTIGGARWAFVMLAISTGLLLLFQRRKLWPSPGTLAIAVVVFMLFSVIGQNRRAVSDFIKGQDTAPTSDEVTEGSFGDSADFANYEFLSYVLAKIPEESKTYSYFTQYLELVTKPIPRVLWSTKPVGSPIRLVNLNAYGNFAGRTPSAVGDGWVSLGWLGVFMTLSLAGYGLGAYYRGVIAGPSSPQAHIAFFTVVPLVLQWSRDGGTSIAEFLFFVLSPILVWILFKRLLSLGGKVKLMRGAHSIYSLDPRRGSSPASHS